MIYVVTIVSILGGIQGLFLSFTLATLRKQRLAANKFLALDSFILSAILVIAFLHFSRLVLHTPHLFNVTPLLMPLFGPLLFFYVQHLLDPQTRFSRYQLLHFLPFFLFLKLHWPMLNKTGEIKISYLMNIFEDRWQPVLNTPAIARIAHLAFYLALCFLLYLAAKKSQQTENGRAGVRLMWIRSLILISVVIWTTYTFLYFYDQNLLNLSMPFLVTAALYFTGYFAFRYPEIFREVQVKPLTQKYESSRLTKQKKATYCEALLRILREEKIYRRPDLKLVFVAEQLQISAQNLSQIVNENFQQSFPDFVNHFRVEEAKKRLLDPAHKHLTIIAIANEVGFNSKSAFNAAFKRFTGLTPSEFIRNHSPAF